MTLRLLAVPLLAILGSVAFTFLIIFALPLLLLLILDPFLHFNMVSSVIAYFILVLAWVLALNMR